jgi:hypothetical protein
MQNTDAQYISGWNDLRRRQRAYVAITFGGFVGMAILMQRSFLGNFAFYLIPVWIIASGISAARYNLFACPRCGKRFFQMGEWGNNSFQRRCGYCGLEKPR